jgi:hypothetical protein
MAGTSVAKRRRDRLRLARSPSPLAFLHCANPVMVTVENGGHSGREEFRRQRSG